MLKLGADLGGIGIGEVGALELAAFRGHHHVLRVLCRGEDASNELLAACVIAGLAHDALTLLQCNWGLDPSAICDALNCSILDVACAAGDYQTVSMLLGQHAVVSDKTWLAVIGSADHRLRAGPHAVTTCSRGSDGTRLGIARALAARGSCPSASVVAAASQEGCPEAMLHLLLRVMCGEYGPRPDAGRKYYSSVADAATSVLPHARSRHTVERLRACGAAVGTEQVAAACGLQQGLYPGEPFFQRPSEWDSDRVEAVTAMLRAMSDPVCSRDADGRTVLFYAVLGGNAPLVRALIAAGADPACTGNDGRTALDLAKWRDEPRFHVGLSEHASERLSLVVLALVHAVPLCAPPPPGTADRKRRADAELPTALHQTVPRERLLRTHGSGGCSSAACAVAALADCPGVCIPAGGGLAGARYPVRCDTGTEPESAADENKSCVRTLADLL